MKSCLSNLLVFIEEVTNYSRKGANSILSNIAPQAESILMNTRPSTEIVTDTLCILLNFHIQILFFITILISILRALHTLETKQYKTIINT